MDGIPKMQNPVIRNSSDYKDRNGLLGKAILIENEIVKIYTVSDKSKYVTANVNIVNNTALDVEVKLWVSEDDTPTEVDLIESKIVLEPDAVYVRNYLILDKLESIFAQSTSDHVIIRIDGYDDRPN